jgi:hypothetical protein
VIAELALLVAGAIAASELFLRLPLMQQVSAVVAMAHRSVKTLGSKRISDHWKEVVLPAYSLRIGGRSLLFFLLLCLGLLPIAMIGLVAPGGLAQWLEFLMRPFSIIVLCLCSILYIFARTRLARV